MTHFQANYESFNRESVLIILCC